MSEVSIQQAERMAEELAVTAATLDGLTHRLLTQIRAFDESGAWHQLGAVSCAQFLSWRIGMDPGAARERVRVARALGELPFIDGVLAAGELSFSKVRALTRVATVENETELVEVAMSATASQLEKIVRLYRQAQDVSPTEAKHREMDRWVSCRSVDDGLVRVTAQVFPEEAETIMTAIEAARSRLYSERVSAETSDARDSGQVSRADALVALAEGQLRGAPEGTHGRPPVEVLVHIDANTLTGHLDRGGHGLSREASRRLCCDAGLVPVLEEETGKILDVGRKTRAIPASLRRALHVRDGGCRFPGCQHRYVDAHHIKHWIDGGATSLDNTILLCRRHHRLVHEGGFCVEREAGDLAFRDPHGRLVQRVPAVPRRRLPTRASRRAPIPRWDGTRPNYRWIVDTMTSAQRTKKEQAP